MHFKWNKRPTPRTGPQASSFTRSMLLIVAVLLAACGAPAPAAEPDGAAGTSAGSAVASTVTNGAPVEITFAMNAIANEIPGWTAAVDEANKLLAPKKISIKIQNIPAAGWTEYYQKNVAQLAAGKSADIGRIAESLMPVVIDKEQVLDLTDRLSDLDLAQYFETTFKNSAVRDGHTYGVPSGVYYMLLYYNADLFDRAGVPYPSSDWSKPSSFAQIREAAKKLTSGEGANKTFGLSAGPYMAFIGMYAKGNGGQNVFDQNGGCTLTDQQSTEVYQWFDDMLRVDGSMPRPTDTTVVPPMEMFKAGRLGMLIDGTWSLAPLKEMTSAKVGIAAIPAAAGNPSYTSQFVDSWIVWKGTQHPAESWEAIKALLSAEATLAVAKQGVGGTPVQKQAAATWQAEVLGQSFGESGRAAVAEGLEHTLAVPYNAKYQEIDDKANQNMDAWLLGQISAQDYAAKVCEIINTTLQ